MSVKLTLDLQEAFISCPNCDEVIMKSVNNEYKIRSKILKTRGNEIYAVCKGCNGEVIVPLKLDIGIPLILDK